MGSKHNECGMKKVVEALVECMLGRSSTMNDNRGIQKRESGAGNGDNRKVSKAVKSQVSKENM